MHLENPSANGILAHKWIVSPYLFISSVWWNWQLQIVNSQSSSDLPTHTPFSLKKEKEETETLKSCSLM